MVILAKRLGAPVEAIPKGAFLREHRITVPGKGEVGPSFMKNPKGKSWFRKAIERSFRGIFIPAVLR